MKKPSKKHQRSIVIYLLDGSGFCEADQAIK